MPRPIILPLASSVKFIVVLMRSVIVVKSPFPLVVSRYFSVS